MYGSVAAPKARAAKPTAWIGLPFQGASYRVLLYLVLNVLLAILSAALVLTFGLFSLLLCTDAPVVQTTHWMVLLEVELYNRLIDFTARHDDGAFRQSSSKRIFVHFELGSGTATSSMEGFRMTHGVSKAMLVYFGGGKLLVAAMALVSPSILLTAGAYCLASLVSVPPVEPLLLRLGAGVVCVYLGCAALHATAEWTLRLTRCLCSEPFASYEYLHGILPH
ncbi:hypothetical protein SPRG_10549 [Saprolegnia parasitica CBS 223.65]|uniref:Uncharacterized protein n=1 Tax=Saprolegnia parasitica (strain CBS 223.65) TaxID=695850 RepID=A0A067CAE2_SAPPC|nr:hypothetical protein SPRG_10549 [Saprolegnia parasitica CBS 223.65]KDO23772.1 hypothetical protein SPRG_10549 [Saprolegnia parasitica CBS 223.65]|eukprot:XP_012205587.1 hypothetical protein SPRG_10549 [Saprolegnia parasitica CBS 223.65]